MAAPAQPAAPGAPDAAGDALLDVRRLTVRFGASVVVDDVSFAIAPGEKVGLVGESGSGKSITALSLLRLVDAATTTGEIRFEGEDLVKKSERQMRAIRGSRIGMIFQEPMTALNPLYTIGNQIAEVLELHEAMRPHAARARAIELLARTGIPEPDKRVDVYPHQLSGGQRQRAMIAMALACRPRLLLCDEPTTALDVTIQAQILALLDELQAEMGMALLFITHDLNLVRRFTHRVGVMEKGRLVESGATDEVFARPQHAYTQRLLASRPVRVAPPLPDDAPPLLHADAVGVSFAFGDGLFRKRRFAAVRAATLTLRRGETLGIVGESGCGKSTLARAVLQLVDPRQGSVVWLGGKDLMKTRGNELRKMRREFQIVFQDPLASLDPRMPIGKSIAEPLITQEPHLSAADVRDRVKDMMKRVGLDPAWINRYPHEFSGGQNQRVGIARAMIVRPQLVICDEAVSALDVSIQRQIVDLLMKLQAEFGMSMMFISHDLSVVRQISHRIMVLYLGRIVELADREEIYENPLHPYTRGLISAVPLPDPKLERARTRIKLHGDLPSPLDSRAALTFLKSKLIDDPDAEQYVPQLVEAKPGHFVAEHDPV
jgi:oligopeptide/dipeptide ABC transporter ATP-binding protein